MNELVTLSIDQQKMSSFYKRIERFERRLEEEVFEEMKEYDDILLIESENQIYGPMESRFHVWRYVVAWDIEMLIQAINRLYAVGYSNYIYIMPHKAKFMSRNGYCVYFLHVRRRRLRIGKSW